MSSGRANKSIADGLQKATLVRVVDGDTLVVSIDGVESKVRLIGVDAPESVYTNTSKNTAEGITASDYATSLLNENQI